MNGFIFLPCARRIKILKKKNELLLKDVKHFDAQNPVIGSLMMEVNLRKKKIRVNFWINHLTSGTWKLGLHMKKTSSKSWVF